MDCQVSPRYQGTCAKGTKGCRVHAMVGKSLLRAVNEILKTFDESKHPRAHGKFSSYGDAANAARGASKKAEQKPSIFAHNRAMLLHRQAADLALAEGKPKNAGVHQSRATKHYEASLKIKTQGKSTLEAGKIAPYQTKLNQYHAMHQLQRQQRRMRGD